MNVQAASCSPNDMELSPDQEQEGEVDKKTPFIGINGKRCYVREKKNTVHP